MFDIYLQLAKENKILPDSNKWKITNSMGITLTHYCGLFGYLPNGFNFWSLKDSDGDSVAHWAARNKFLPSNFKDWDLTNNNGITVRQVYKEYLTKLAK